ncbi:hypothetical protein L0128_01355 [candidate division KSB1 bacterium]|nr:hypothetical protein [candidate division KSB1 bacterium]
MGNIPQEQWLYFLVNSLVYGMVKAEIKVAGRSMALSRTATNFANEEHLQNLQNYGVQIENSPDPFQMMFHYRDANVQHQLIGDQDYLLEQQDNKMSVTAKKCLYMAGCAQIIADGMKEFSCHICSTLIHAAHPAGKRLQGHSVNVPGNCQITIELKS